MGSMVRIALKNGSSNSKTRNSIVIHASLLIINEVHFPALIKTISEKLKMTDLAVLKEVFSESTREFKLLTSQRLVIEALKPARSANNRETRGKSGKSRQGVRYLFFFRLFNLMAHQNFIFHIYLPTLNVTSFII